MKLTLQLRVLNQATRFLSFLASRKKEAQCSNYKIVRKDV